VGLTIQIARAIVANALMGVPGIARWRSKRGRTSLRPTEENLQRFAFGIMDDNPVIAAHVKGADVCEIGPGDHLATGLVLLAAGARSYTALDRFQGDYWGAEAQAWYTLVRRHRGGPTDFRADVGTIASAVEDVDSLPTNAFDLIVSQAVGEHVSDIHAFALATLKMLRPGGIAVHNVDFSNHGIGDGDEFLSVPGWIWHLMGSNRGLPNRKTKAEFLEAFSIMDVRIERESPTWASFVMVRH
jgi:SAM-dependent methyltransferase